MNKLYIAIIVSMFLFVGCENSVNEAPMITTPAHVGTDSNTIAIYIIMDGSGSMRYGIVNTNNVITPKWRVANQALLTLGDQIDDYLMMNTNRTILTGIVLFKGEEITLTDFGVLSNCVREVYQKWINGYSGPDGNTPLGEAILKAADCMVNDKIKSKHIMAITDGESNRGRDPATIIDSLKTRGDIVSTHFIAFDVDANVFNEVKKMGCGVVSASSGAGLQTQINKIVREEILLEKED